MTGHCDNFWDNSPPRPVYTKHLDQFLQVDGRGLPDGEYNIPKPRHTEVAELLIEELLAKLSGKQGNIFDDRLPDTPLLVRCKLDDCGKKGLREEVNADDCTPLGLTLAGERQQTYHYSRAPAC